jgi:hypothetical protein
MKNLKLIFVIIVLFIIAVSGISKAQDSSKTEEKKKYKHTPEEQAKIMTDKMKSHLDLTSEQYNKILKLQTDYIIYNRDLRTKDIISRSEIKQRREEYHNGIKNTLTADQMKKWENMMKKKQKKYGEHNR